METYKIVVEREKKNNGDNGRKRSITPGYPDPQ